MLRSAARALRDPSSIISVLVRNQAGEVLKAAIQDGDLAATEHNLTAEWGHESLYGGRVRLFTAESLEAMLLESSLAVTAERGVRVSYRITCRQGFREMMSTSGFSSWSASWAGDRSLSQSPATRIAWHIAQVRA